MVKKMQDEVTFGFIETVKKVPKTEKEKKETNLRCHNALCKAKKNCKNYKGFQEGYPQLNRESCRVYDAKESVYVGKSRKFR